MGLLQSWDRRDQETLESANESRAQSVSARRMLLIGLAILFGSVLLGAVLGASGLSDDAAASVRIAALFALSVVLFTIAVVQTRRRRREWRERRSSSPSSGGS